MLKMSDALKIDLEEIIKGTYDDMDESKLLYIGKINE